MFYGHAMFIGNSQKRARYLFFPVYRCRVDQTEPRKLRPRKRRLLEIKKKKKNLNSSQFLSPEIEMFYGHPMFIDNSQKGARCLSCRVRGKQN